MKIPTKKWMLSVGLIITILSTIVVSNWTSQSVAETNFIELEFIPKVSDEYRRMYIYEVVVHNQTDNYAAHISSDGGPGIAIDKLLFIYSTDIEVSESEGSKPGIRVTMMTPGGLNVRGFQEIESISTGNFLDSDAVLIRRYLEEPPSRRIRLSLGDSYDMDLHKDSETQLLVIEKPD